MAQKVIAVLKYLPQKCWCCPLCSYDRYKLENGEVVSGGECRLNGCGVDVGFDEFGCPTSQDRPDWCPLVVVEDE